MAYLHCHSCNWSQDDFWDWNVCINRSGFYTLIAWPVRIGWGYNPISVFLSYVFVRKGYWWPRRIEHDKDVARELGWKRSDPHSWWLIGWEFKRMLRKFKEQTWLTWEAFKATKEPRCPKCGQDNFNVD